MKTYLLFSNDLIKIGKTKNHRNRMSAYRTHNPEFKQILILDGNHENELHSMFSSKLVKGEWYNLDMSDYIKILTKYATQIEKEELVSNCEHSFTFDTLCSAYSVNDRNYLQDDGILCADGWNIISYTPSSNNRWHLFLSTSTDTSVTTTYVFQ